MNQSELMQPVEGISMEQYGQLSAQIMNLSQDQLDGFLAQHGLDRAKWERVSAEWNDRMSRDASAKLATIYGQAFQSAGAGQFGQQAQAVASMDNYGGNMMGSSAGGDAPMPFEQVCEIQGAMQAWATTGQDVNAMIAQTFQMNAADFSNAHTWWLTQISSDMNKLNEYNQLVNQASQKYSAGAPAAPDSDLDF